MRLLVLTMLLFLSVAVCDVIDETHTTVGSHLFELQLSKYIGYPNAFSKVTPTIYRLDAEAKGSTVFRIPEDVYKTRG